MKNDSKFKNDGYFEVQILGIPGGTLYGKKQCYTVNTDSTSCSKLLPDDISKLHALRDTLESCKELYSGAKRSIHAYSQNNLQKQQYSTLYFPSTFF